VSVFEAGMLICFGFAWPINIYKSIKSKTSKGKSGLFLYILILGYIFGIINRIVSGANIVLVLYIINLIMISADTVLYHINKVRDKAPESRENVK